MHVYQNYLWKGTNSRKKDWGRNWKSFKGAVLDRGRNWKQLRRDKSMGTQMGTKLGHPIETYRFIK
jgi:hypothetical protein